MFVSVCVCAHVRKRKLCTCSILIGSSTSIRTQSLDSLFLLPAYLYFYFFTAQIEAVLDLSAFVSLVSLAMVLKPICVTRRKLVCDAYGVRGMSDDDDDNNNAGYLNDGCRDICVRGYSHDKCIVGSRFGR